MDNKAKAVASGVLLAVATFALPVISHAAEVDARVHNETARINRGARTGELTHGEAVRLRAHKRHIQREIKRMRARNGGHLTPAERARIKREESRLNRHIYNKKHNAVVR
jgi:hypothetical protein